MNAIHRGATSATGQSLRPDLVILNEMVIDVKVPLDIAGAFERRHDENCLKYQPVLQHLSSQGYDTHLHTFCVGALGSWWTLNYGTLVDSGLSKLASRVVAGKCIRTAIHWSRNIWVTHVGDTPQAF